MTAQALCFDFAATRTAPVASVAPWHHGLRPYQREAVEATWEALRTGDSTAIVLPTGCGKTRTGAAVFNRMLLERPGRARGLWLANRDFLLEDAATRLREGCLVGVSIEKAERQMSFTPIVCGSVQTLVRKDRRETIKRDTFDIVAFDECHHASSPGAMEILNWFQAKRFGLTATLTRHDKVGAWNAWGSIAYEKSLDWAWDEGYLVKPIPIARPVDSIDLSKVKTTAGDLNLGGLEKEIAAAAAPIAHIAFEEAERRPTIIYTPGVASAHAVAATLNLMRPGCARAVDANTPDDERRQVLLNFDAGSLQFIVNCGIYLEGLDVPKCQCIVIARPTKSQSLYIQMAGRGGRPEGWIGQLDSRGERLLAIAASGKPNFKLVDITGHAGRHNLCAAATLLGKETPAKELAEVIAANPGMDLVSAATEARAAVLRQEREIALLAQSAVVKARRESFSLFGEYGVVADSVSPLDVGSPANERDLEWLGSNKLPAEGLSHADVLKLQRSAAVWRQHGFASFKQRRCLNKAGIATPHNLSFAAASQVIEHLIANRWRPNMEYVATVLEGRAA